MANIYLVHEANLEEFYKRMDTLKKKCDKVGAKCSYKIVGFEYHTELDEEDMQPYTVKYYQVEAEGAAVIEGWEIVAVVEYINNSSIVTILNDDVEIPARYYDGDNSCEHCNSIRPRKKTCILYNREKDEFKKVGTTCLRAFTGVENIDSYMKAMDWVKKAKEYSEMPVAAPGGIRRYSLEDILCYGIECVEKFGYTSTKDYRSTADRTKDYFMIRELNRDLGWCTKDCIEEMESVNFDANRPEYHEKAKAIIKYVRETLKDESNYTHNVKAVYADDYVRMRHVGIAVSVIVNYDRYIRTKTDIMNKARIARELSTSNYVGEVGERIDIDVVEFACVHSYETIYGLHRIYKFRDDKDNVFVWKTSVFVPDPKLVVRVSGTVKNHKEYNGVKETEMTRCKFSKEVKTYKKQEVRTDDAISRALDEVLAAWES